MLDRQAMVCEPGEPLLARFVMDGAPVWDRVFQGYGGNYWVTWRRHVFTPEQDESYRISVKVEDLELGFFDIEVRRDGRWWNLTRNDGFVGIADSGPFLFGFRIEEGALEQAYCDAAGQGLEDCDVQQVDDETGGTPRLFNTPGGTQQAPAAVITIPQNSAMLGGVPISEYVFIAELEDDGVTQGGAVPRELPDSIPHRHPDGSSRNRVRPERGGSTTSPSARMSRSCPGFPRLCTPSSGPSWSLKAERHSSLKTSMWDHPSVRAMEWLSTTMARQRALASFGDWPAA